MTRIPNLPNLGRDDVDSAEDYYVVRDGNANTDKRTPAGSAGGRDVGTGADQVPTNSDLSDVIRDSDLATGRVPVSSFSGGHYTGQASGNTLTISGTPTDELTGEPKFHVGRRCFVEGEARTITEVAEVEGNTVATVDGAALSAGSVGVYLGASMTPKGLSIGQHYLPTEAEVAAGVTIVDYRFPVGTPERYGAAADGEGDDTQPITDAIAVRQQSGGGIVELVTPGGRYRITSSILVPSKVTIRGLGAYVSEDSAPSIIIKDGTFTGLSLRSFSGLEFVSVEGAQGNGGDGVQLAGNSAFLRFVSSYGHGNDGIRIGADEEANTNLWRIDHCRSYRNGRHGIYIHDGGAGPDANAGVLTQVDAGSNGGAGLRIDHAALNYIYGFTAQVNTGPAVALGPQAFSNQFFGGDLEENNNNGSYQVVIEEGADANAFIAPTLSGPDSVSDSGVRTLLILHMGGTTLPNSTTLRATTTYEDRLTFQNDLAPENSRIVQFRHTRSDGGLLIRQLNDDMSVKTEVGRIHPTGLAEFTNLREGQQRVAKSGGSTGGTGSAGPGNQYVAVTIDGVTYKLLHDGTL